MTQLSYLSTDSVKTRTALRWIQAENAWLKLTFSQFMRGPCKESTCVKTVTYYHTNYSRSHLSWSSQPTKNCVNSSKKFHINSTCIWKKYMVWCYGALLRTGWTHTRSLTLTVERATAYYDYQNDWLISLICDQSKLSPTILLDVDHFPSNLRWYMKAYFTWQNWRSNLYKRLMVMRSTCHEHQLWQDQFAMKSTQIFCRKKGNFWPSNWTSGMSTFYLHTKVVFIYFRYKKWVDFIVNCFHNSCPGCSENWSCERSLTKQDKPSMLCRNRVLTNCFFSCRSSLCFSSFSAPIACGSYSKSRTINLENHDDNIPTEFSCTIFLQSDATATICDCLFCVATIWWYLCL